MNETPNILMEKLMKVFDRKLDMILEEGADPSDGALLATIERFLKNQNVQVDLQNSKEGQDALTKMLAVLDDYESDNDLTKEM